MKIEAFVYSEDGKEIGVIVYNDIDIESIINDIDITYKGGWDYASLEYDEGYGTYIAHSDGTYFKGWDNERN